MTREQELFWKEIKEIQNFVVNVSLSKLSKYTNEEMLLNDVTYETIYKLMELIDGYKNNSIRGEIINSVSGHTINSDIKLHDYCEEYLKCSEI